MPQNVRWGGGVFFKFYEPPPPPQKKKGIFWHCILSFLEICQLSIVFNESAIVQHTMMSQLECFWNSSNRQIVFVNIYKYGEKSSFKHFSCFLKNRGLLKSFDFFSWFKKKRVKNVLFHRKKGYFSPNNFLKKGHILHARTHMCTHFSYESRPGCHPSQKITWYVKLENHILLNISIACFR